MGDAIVSSQTWGPSNFGKIFTFSPSWSITLIGEKCSVIVDGVDWKVGLKELANCTFKSGIFWGAVVIENRDRPYLNGIPNEEIKELVNAVGRAAKRLKRKEEISALLAEFDKKIKPIVDWSTDFLKSAHTQLKARGWLTSEFHKDQARIKPEDLGELLAHPIIQAHILSQPKETQDRLNTWKLPLNKVVSAINESHRTNQLTKYADFFNSVEKSPLTEEQRAAVVCFDNRLLLVACAGSGKTSTMVAKAGYALTNNYVDAERMVLLAFNGKAAKELKVRLNERLTPLGLRADKINTKTFHAFGLEIIGQATGKKPSLAPWVEESDKGEDLNKLMSIVDTLKDTDAGFRTNWDMFRIVLSQDMPAFGKDEEVAESWDRANGRPAFWTKGNNLVKSYGEQIIADWLFYNGVNYQYEAPYKYDVADAEHRQYKPDFYFPDIDVYLEHWGLDENGEPPKSFEGYKESMAWKKKTHKEKQTTLLETTTAGIARGQIFEYLERELTSRGIELDPNPDRPSSGRKPIENGRLVKTFRAFMTHAKSNRLSMQDLQRRLDEGNAGPFSFRHRIFLNLMEKISGEWDSELRKVQAIDFEDMLNIAIDCIETGKWKSPYDLVMVDEFQDASHARAKLVAGLVKEQGKNLFAVGDDWQSINRFAGADISVMTNFSDLYCESVILKLETTFRCVKPICDVSSGFVMKNPRQISKSVRSIHAPKGRATVEDLFRVTKIDPSKPDSFKPTTNEEAVRILRVEKEEQIRSAVEIRLKEIAQLPAIEGRKTKVYVLGRYKKEKKYVPLNDYGLEVSFITVHSSKGLEADHVILPKITSETLGFPSRIADDPVLKLAMPSGDSFEFAEERRLFYVALTRAKKTATLITIKGKESAFVLELVRDHEIIIYAQDGEVASSEVCKKCKLGFLTIVPGQYGPFIGCTRYPRCDYRRKIEVKKGTA